MDIFAYNRRAWDRQAEMGNRWTVPVGPEVIAAARRGEWQVLLTPTRPVPRGWFPDLAGLEVFCLASGGGQQGPVLAAAGAAVTVLDASPAQLARDRLVAEREGLPLQAVEGDMADLSAFPEGNFGLVFHPCSNCFVPDVRPVWREAFRVLRPGGVLLAGFCNPALYLVDDALAERGELVVRHAVPYADLTSLTAEERRRYTEKDQPLVYGHTLEDQVGGQLEAGFLLAGLYEDRDPSHPLAKFLPTFLATRADEAGRPDTPHHKKKPGYFTSEDKLVSQIREETGTGDARNAITYLVEAADDIVYSTVDIEDGVKKGVINWEEVKNRLTKEAGGADPMLETVLNRSEKKLREAEIPIEPGPDGDEAMAQTFRTFAITEAVLEVTKEFIARYGDIMDGRFRGELIEAPSIAPLIRACKTTARHGIFRRDPEVLEREIAGREVIHRLMDRFWEGVKG